MLENILKLLTKILEAIFGPQGTPKKHRQPVRIHNVDHIKKWEGYRGVAYQDTGGVWTIGYGHTKSAKPGMQISRERAEELLRGDIQWVEDVLNTSVLVPVNQQQYDVLGSFVYNVGGTAFRNSTMLRKLNAYDYAGVTHEFGRWVHDNGRRIQGLVNRREDEARLWKEAITDEQLNRNSENS